MGNGFKRNEKGAKMKTIEFFMTNLFLFLYELAKGFKSRIKAANKAAAEAFKSDKTKFDETFSSYHSRVVLVKNNRGEYAKVKAYRLPNGEDVFWCYPGTPHSGKDGRITSYNPFDFSPASYIEIDNKKGGSLV